MAQRPIFIPCFHSDCLVRIEYVDFVWYPGIAPSQRKRSVSSLHSAAREKDLCKHPLEVSTKSEDKVGCQLSAFNLSVKTEKHKPAFTVETAFQSSKVFQNGGPYEDLLYGSSLSAKKDSRIKNSGDLLKFKFFGTEWGLEPKTAFYDWLFLNALKKNPWAIEQLDDFDAFTDIEFNPKKSINCQAYSVALFQSLKHRKLLDKALENKKSFLRVLSIHHSCDTHRNSESQQPDLF
ncbi:hypothetical protein MAMP_00268 [Methylophaga aminisulfidivorans MP]|uniref:Uncharacterized protein n=1 Tax=Methylophaga aminisulfidivorans MP TaxID=1026882 RepID=F5T1I4_9GAMM|nr:hypothetical protein [Methylophaga aminisulfidivorans]EGL53080.1 hypothetical protein MAMP_00268 [Methylophaga aminisulfidivorans MP]